MRRVRRAAAAALREPRAFVSRHRAELLLALDGVVALLIEPVREFALALVAGALVSVVYTEDTHDRESPQRHEAMRELGEAARRFHTRIATSATFSGTSVFDGGEFTFDLGHVADHIKAMRFDFVIGHRQDEWANFAAGIRAGRGDFIGRVGAIGPLPTEELTRARDLADVADRAVRRAYMVATAYAGHDVDEPHPVARYKGPDQKVDLSMLAAYRDLGEDLAELARGLARLAAMAPADSLAI